MARLSDGINGVNLRSVRSCLSYLRGALRIRATGVACCAAAEAEAACTTAAASEGGGRAETAAAGAAPPEAPFAKDPHLPGSILSADFTRKTD